MELSTISRREYYIWRDNCNDLDNLNALLLEFKQWDGGVMMIVTPITVSQYGERNDIETRDNDYLWLYDRDFPQCRDMMDALCSGDVRGRAAEGMVAKCFHLMVPDEYIEQHLPSYVENMKRIKC